MPRIPYPVEGTITDINGTGASNAIVIIYNLNNGDSIQTTTNSSGVYVIDLANAEREWVDGEIILIRSYIEGTFYRAKEEEATISGNSMTKNLTLEVSYPTQTKELSKQNIDKIEHDPTSNAKRSLLVDDHGKKIGSENPLYIRDFNLEVAKGLMDGHSVVRLRGRSTIVDTGDTSDIWAISGDINVPSDSTTFYVSSTDAADTGIVIVVQGLDENYDAQTGFAVLNGQNQVAVTGTWRSLHAAINNSATEYAGDLYIAASDTLTAGVPDTAEKIYGKMLPLHQNLLNCYYMVPRSHTLFLRSFIFSAQRATDVTAKTMFKYDGGIWFTGNVADVYQQIGEIPIIPDAPLPAKSQIKGRFTALSNNVEVTLFIAGILVHNDYL